MHVRIQKADGGGSGFYRMDEVARAATEAGLVDKVTVHTDIDVEGTRDPLGVIKIKEFDIEGADLVVIQRPVDQGMHALILALKKAGVPVIIDLDDDFHSIHKNNVAAEAMHTLHNKDWLWRSCLEADALTVSTPLLQKYGQQGRATVVRNYLPERIFDVKGDLPKTAVGWTGLVATHPSDLQATKGALKGLPVPFVAVGGEAEVRKVLGIDAGEGRFFSLPWADSVEDYWLNVAQFIQVGIAPLEVSRFNKAKSWLKGLEYACLGVPFVASPLPEYMLLSKAGAGLIGTSAGRWRSHLDLLLNNPSYYAEQADSGRQAARKLTLEGHIEEWVSVWTSALNRA